MRHNHINLHDNGERIPYTPTNIEGIRKIYQNGIELPMLLN